MPQPIVFLDPDNVVVLGTTPGPNEVLDGLVTVEIPGGWEALVITEARNNLAILHNEFHPAYVITSTWTRLVPREQMCDVFQRTGMGFVSDNLHQHWTTPKSPSSSAKQIKIEGWMERYYSAGQRIVIIDDDESGWRLLDSQYGKFGVVVLCEFGKGFTSGKLDEARRALRLRKLLEHVNMSGRYSFESVCKSISEAVHKARAKKSNTSPSPSWVCIECGHRELGSSTILSQTLHMGICDICHQQKAVTAAEDFGDKELK